MAGGRMVWMAAVFLPRMQLVEALLPQMALPVEGAAVEWLVAVWIVTEPRVFDEGSKD